LLRENRAFLSPWQPRRSDFYFTDEAQQEFVDKAGQERDRGASLPLVIVDDEGRIAGTVTLQSIIRGAFQSCSVGYWLAEGALGRGLATAAVREATQVAFRDLRLHRVQAETLPHNVRSRRLLERLGFVQYGSAPAYLHIAGSWQHNLLYQLLTPTPDRVQVPD
jgi:ribosomal-protein-alanine N-acetyltransferase